MSDFDYNIVNLGHRWLMDIVKYQCGYCKFIRRCKRRDRRHSTDILFSKRQLWNRCRDTGHDG
jgi:hypothetical protein